MTDEFDAYDDPRVASRARLIRQLAGLQDPTRQAYDVAQRHKDEFERDFPVVSPGDRERVMRVIRLATGT